MEEDKDIEILETQIQACKECKFATCEQCEISYTEVKAIQNLIARYKEVKQNYINPSKARFSYYDKGKGVEVVIEGFIPKSKVKEKIEELLKEHKDNFTDRRKQKISFAIKVLQELLDFEEV